MMTQASLGSSAQKQSDFEKISAALHHAESVFARIADLAGDLVGTIPMLSAPVSEGSGTIGALASRAEQLIDYAGQVQGEIDRIRAATNL